MLKLDAPLLISTERTFGPPTKDSLHHESKLLPGHLSLFGISRAIASSATVHGKILGIQNGFGPNGFDKIKSSGWAVIGLRLRVQHPVPLDRPVTCSTWVAAIDGGRLIREYEIRLGNQSLVQATHDFVLFDRNNRRAMLPPKAAREFLGGLKRTHAYTLQISRQLEHDWPETLDQDAELSAPFEVSEDAIDENQHVNNAVYLRWLESAAIGIPASGFELGIEYLNESLSGDQVRIKSFARESGRHFSFQSPEKVFALGAFLHLVSK